MSSQPCDHQHCTTVESDGELQVRGLRGDVGFETLRVLRVSPPVSWCRVCGALKVGRVWNVSEREAFR